MKDLLETKLIKCSLCGKKVFVVGKTICQICNTDVNEPVDYDKENCKHCEREIDSSNSIDNECYQCIQENDERLLEESKHPDDPTR